MNKVKWFFLSKEKKLKIVKESKEASFNAGLIMEKELSKLFKKYDSKHR